ncbi:MAG: DUF268 domain-containing protein [Bacteroidetes bacterium]|nr:DUF268 domain-containing protein [Bacteroidota bacterium]
MRWRDRLLMLDDASSSTQFDRHYIYHPAWAIRKIKEYKVQKHVDISSILSFSATLSAFIPVEFYDYRPANLVLDNLTTGSEDLTRLSFLNNSIPSLSCMHTIEHIGLGRYGDPLDYDGDLKAINELSRVLSPGGILLMVVPVGKENKVVFNAHRIYEPRSFIQYFEVNGLKLKEFALIPENEEDGHLVSNPSPELLFRQHYACGCFLFIK